MRKLRSVATTIDPLPDLLAGPLRPDSPCEPIMRIRREIMGCMEEVVAMHVLSICRAMQREITNA